MSLLAFKLNTPEIIMILIAGVLLFGRRLPAFGRRLGMAVVAIRGQSSADTELWLFTAVLLLVWLWLMTMLLFALAV